MRYRYISLFLCIALLFSGCISDSTGQKDYEDTGLGSMNPTPDLSYEVPLSVPHILVDQVGYTTDGGKTVIMRGADLPDKFDVINVDTNEVVYTGVIKEKERENTAGDLIGYGDFTDLNEEGNYYIQGSILGRSYEFIISDDVYDETFKDAVDILGEVQLKKINVTLPKERSEQAEIIMQGGWITDKNGNQDIKLASEVMVTVLTAYELYPGSFENTNEGADGTEPPLLLQYLKQQTEWMQNLQDEKTGGIYGGIIADTDNVVTAYSMADIDQEATTAYAAALAKFSYSYKKYDQQYADSCLKSADRAWKYINNQQHEHKEALKEMILSAAAELYRASGWQTYHTAAKKILETGPDVTSSDWAAYGSVTYLTTRHAVDKKYCESIMKQLMSRAEKISAASRVGAYLTEGNPDFTDTKDLLWNMVILSIVDYVITNHEYATVIENYQHYFSGCNRSAVCLVNEEGCDSIGAADAGIQDDLRLNAYHIFMLSRIMNKNN